MQCFQGNQAPGIIKSKKNEPTADVVQHLPSYFYSLEYTNNVHPMKVGMDSSTTSVVFFIIFINFYFSQIPVNLTVHSSNLHTSD